MNTGMNTQPKKDNMTTPEPTVHVTSYAVSCLPEDDPATRHFTLKIEYRGAGRWAVLDSPFCLNASGEWDYEHLPSERTEEWLTEHRFDLDTALRLAKEQAPRMTVNGHTVADVLARMDKEDR